MSLFRRSLTVAVVSSVALSGLALGASADEPDLDRAAAAAGRAADRPVAVARGLIVKTTTSKPSASLLRATDRALDSADDSAAVADSDQVAGKVSTIDFDETVPAEVAAEAADVLEGRSDVVWAAPNTLRQTATVSPQTPTDPYFPKQRNLWDTTYSSGGYSIKAPSLWRATRGNPDVVVAVVDTGIRAEHPDLAGKLVAGYDMIGADQDTGSTSYTVAGDGDGRDDDPSDPGDWSTSGQCGPAQDSSWHGTFVAGMVAAKTDNGIGIAGAAPNVKVQPVRVLGHCGGWDSDILAGITWASGGTVPDVPANPTPAKVVNLSLGYTYGSDQRAERDAACTMYEEVASAGRVRGSVFIAAAGNDGSNADYAIPASCPGYVSVGATSLRGFSAWYSNVGTSVDLSAPGGDGIIEGNTDPIVSLVNSGKKGPVSSAYARYEGTSMAAPQVAAGAALLYSLGLTSASSVENALYASAGTFHSKSKSYANKALRLGSNTYYVDLNCVGHTWCGRGILDLSKVQAPIGDATVSGDPVVGEPLVAGGSWNGSPTLRYAWFRDGALISGADAKTYIPTTADIGAKLSVEVAPTASAFRAFSTRSAQSTVVPQGPAVTMTGPPDGIRHGADWTTTVTLAGDGVVDGLIEIRRGNGTVMASGTSVDGTAEITIPGIESVAGAYSIRAAYVGSGDTPAASSAGLPVTIGKAKASISRSLPYSVRRTQRAKITVKVSVSGVSRPTGVIRVYDGSRRIKTFTLYGGNEGTRSVSLPKLSKGNHKLKAVYSGNSNINGRTSAWRTLRVR